MSSNRLLLPGVVLLLLCGWAGFELTPGRQLDRAFDRLLHAAGKRDWKTVRGLMADDYRDRWGQDREQAVSAATQVLQQFLVLKIGAERRSVSRQAREATISARLRLEGRGTGLAEMVIGNVNGLRDDFQFAWRRKSWKPWDWKLVSVNQPEIEFDPSMLP